MLGREGRDTLKSYLVFDIANSVADRKDTGVKNADYIARIRFVDYLTVRRHKLLRLGKTE